MKITDWFIPARLPASCPLNVVYVDEKIEASLAPSSFTFDKIVLASVLAAMLMWSNLEIISVQQKYQTSSVGASSHVLSSDVYLTPVVDGRGQLQQRTGSTNDLPDTHSQERLINITFPSDFIQGRHLSQLGPV